MSARAEQALSAAGIGFDPDSGDLRGPAGTARLAPQPAALFALLSERAGDIVTRDELKEHLWPGGRVEFDQGIAFALREVRKTLEEVGADPAVVETLPRRGLRLRAAAIVGPHRPHATVAVWVIVTLAAALAGGLWWVAASARGLLRAGRAPAACVGPAAVRIIGP